VLNEITGGFRSEVDDLIDKIRCEISYIPYTAGGYRNLEFNKSSVPELFERVISEVDRTPISILAEWAAKRETTKFEDKVYSLFGIFGVVLPIIYGEGLESASQ